MRYHNSIPPLRSYRLILSLISCALMALGSQPILWAEDPSNIARQLNQVRVGVVNSVAPAVVVVRVAQKPKWESVGENNPFFNYLPPELQDRLREEWQSREQHPPQDPVFSGQGSGLIIRENGFVLTNAHVVQGAEEIMVRFRSGREFPAQVQGIDENSDLAVLKIEATGLPVIPWGDSANLQIGEMAIAIGAPFNLEFSATFGHISALGRSVLADPTMDQDFIQTDASINPGNSGGPLVNIDGEVIGIITMIRGINTGVGFAVPVNLARQISNVIIEHGRFTRPWLGIQIGALRDDPEALAGDPEVQSGVVVYAIVPDGPAAESGLTEKDIITAVDEHPVASVQTLKNALRRKPIGEEVELHVLRHGKPRKISLRTGNFDEFLAATSSTDSSTRAATSLGLTVGPVTKESATEQGLDSPQGVLVIRVHPETPAAIMRIEPGAIILQIDRQPVNDPAEFNRIVGQSDIHKGIRINLIFNKQLSSVILSTKP